MADDHLNVLARFLTSEFASANEISDEWVASRYAFKGVKFPVLRSCLCPFIVTIFIFSIDGNFTEFENISTVIKPSFYDNNEFVDTLEQRKFYSSLIADSFSNCLKLLAKCKTIISTTECCDMQKYCR